MMREDLGEHGFIQIAELLRKFPPLPADHPLLKEDCAGCNVKFEAGNLVTLVQIGPGSDPEERLKAREGRSYNAVAVPAHWACATGEEVEPE